MPAIASAIAAVSGSIALAGVAYLVVTIWTSRRQVHVEQDERALPPMSVLKPVCGVEPAIYENLRSFCEQDYPSYQVVFCCRDEHDPVISIVRRLIDEFPDADLCLALGGEDGIRNPKIACVAAGFPLAKHETIVFADADVNAPPNTLRAIAEVFADPRVGAASCVYRGIASPGLSSQLGAHHINDHFAPSVMVATAVEAPRFCLGATMAVRRNVLQEIGGLDVLGSHLGDDYMLGARAAERGYRVAIVPIVVSCTVYEPDLSTHLARQLRWARTIRNQRPWGFAFLFVTFPIPFALIALAVSRGTTLAIATLVVVAVARIAQHYAYARALDVRRHNGAWIIPLADTLELLVWCGAFFGNAVKWRTNEYTLGIRGQVN